MVAPRRAALQGLAAAPLLLGAWLQQPGAAHSSTGPRFLTPEEQAAVDAALEVTVPRGKAPVMLRLVFHDAGTFSAAGGDGGCNASVQYELARPENTGLNRGWLVIEKTVAKLKGTAAEGRVSQADLIALAGARAVAVTAGPQIRVPVGRADAAGPDPEGRMPEETLSAAALLANFEAKGLDAGEMVALSGSHTLGSKGFGDPVTFDNTYYKLLLAKPWEDKNNSMASMVGLPSDHVLPDDPTCRPLIERYAADQQAFFDDFAAAYVKMTLLGARWG